jgi:hypothetical protein
MQSINAGFSSLRSLLPHHEGIRANHIVWGVYPGQTNLLSFG